MKVLLVALVGLMLCSPVMAADLIPEPPSGNTEGTSWGTGHDRVDDFLNRHGQHSHGIPRRDNPVGLGLDIEYSFNDVYSAELQGKWDFNNEEVSTYLVGKIKLGKE